MALYRLKSGHHLERRPDGQTVYYFAPVGDQARKVVPAEGGEYRIRGRDKKYDRVWPCHSCKLGVGAVVVVESDEPLHLIAKDRFEVWTG